jgi:hypothetical protein
VLLAPVFFFVVCNCDCLVYSLSILMVELLPVFFLNTRVICNKIWLHREEQHGSMCCSEAKTGRSLMSRWWRPLNARFVVVRALVILGCLVVSQQFAFSARYGDD